MRHVARLCDLLRYVHCYVWHEVVTLTLRLPCNEAIEVLCIESLAGQAVVRDRAELLIDRLGTLVDHSSAFALEVAERAVGYLFEPHLSFLLLFTKEYSNAQ